LKKGRANMKLNVFTESLEELKADVVVFLVEKGRVAVRGMMAEINKAVDGQIAAMLESGEFSAGQDQFLYFFTFGKSKVPRVALAGYDLEDNKHLNPIRSSAAVVVKSLREAGLKRVALVVPTVREWTVGDAARSMVEGALMGLYRFDKYLENKATKNLVEVILVGEAKDRRMLEKAVLLGEMEASGVLLARDVANEPSNVLTPANFANIARKVTSKAKINCKILDEADILREGLGLIHAVAKGSEEPPKLVLLSYNAGRKYPTIGLVGKGMTYDAGGINLKVGDAGGMWLVDMKRDMAGAAAVLGAMNIIGQLQPKINVVAAMPVLENMPSGRAYKPSDILVSYSGKTVEIFNTDAEGRLAMADAMSYLQENYRIDYLVDIATLTGSIVREAGPALIGLFGNDERLLERMRQAGLIAGEETMDWPLYPAYKKRIKSHFADLKNISFKGPSAITSGLFLQEFIREGVKWAHLDIAAVATQFGEGTYKTRGATGAGVRLLTHLILGMGK
ncbi:MAG: leucyl aminopeptidase family protein, partial [Patescibacteria group bacterium]